eukprot:2606434-Pyramimonas_sp.AAC.1
MNAEELVDAPTTSAVATGSAPASLSASAAASSSRPSPTQNPAMDIYQLVTVSGTYKGSVFVAVYEMVIMEHREFARIDYSEVDMEQADEIAPLLTEMCAVDIVEICSPKRVVEMTFRFGLALGLAVTSRLAGIYDCRHNAKRARGSCRSRNHY